MLYILLRYLSFIFIIIICNMFYYNIYSKKNIYINKMYLIKIILIQVIIIYISFIFNLYNNMTITYILCLVNILPLFLYKDVIKNKIYIFLIMYGLMTINELIGSIILMFIVPILDIKIIFPQELLITKSLLSFIPITIMIVIDFFESLYISNILSYIKSLKLEKNFFMLFSSFIVLNISFTIISYTNTQNFILLSIIYFIILLMNLSLLSININNFIIKYKKYTDLKYYQRTINEQSDSFKNINTSFKKIRKQNHDFNNHLIIIKELFKNDEKEVIKYIEEILENYKGV